MCGFCDKDPNPARMVALIHYGFDAQTIHRTVPRFGPKLEVATFTTWQRFEQFKDSVERMFLNLKLRRWYANRSHKHGSGGPVAGAK
jgi:hypothetical protein